RVERCARDQDHVVAIDRGGGIHERVKERARARNAAGREPVESVERVKEHEEAAIVSRAVQEWTPRADGIPIEDGPLAVRGKIREHPEEAGVPIVEDEELALGPGHRMDLREAELHRRTVELADPRGPRS